jgi:hypothetical protein
MAVTSPRKKNPAAVAPVRKGGKKGGLASSVAPAGTSDEALLALLKRLKTASGPAEIQRLSNRIERVIFHKQFNNA